MQDDKLHKGRQFPLNPPRILAGLLAFLLLVNIPLYLAIRANDLPLLTILLGLTVLAYLVVMLIK